MKAAILLLLLSGCAASAPPGVSISEAEAKACAAAGCSVWTEAELRELISRVGAQAQAMLAGELDTHGCLRGRT